MAWRGDGVQPCSDWYGDGSHVKLVADRKPGVSPIEGLYRGLKGTAALAILLRILLASLEELRRAGPQYSKGQTSESLCLVVFEIIRTHSLAFSRTFSLSHRLLIHQLRT